MARPKIPARFAAGLQRGVQVTSAGEMAALAAEAQAFAAQALSADASGTPRTMTGSASVHKAGQRSNPTTDRNEIAKRWQIEAYRHINICGEARYAATLFAAIAGRAEIGISDANALRGKAVWTTEGPEVDALNELAPTVRERTKLVRDYMMHRTIAGECYLIARERQDTDPEYDRLRRVPVWEIIAVTELRRLGDDFEVKFDNGNYLKILATDPIIRMWNPDPNDRREAWSPFRSLLPTLREIEWLTAHIFTQVRSRMMSAGVWFVPNNITFPAPPPDAVNGGQSAIDGMNDAEKFMVSLAASSMDLLDADEVSFPTVVMADPDALENVSQDKLIKFWSEIDDKAMLLRADNVRRFALGMDLPPEQILGASGMAVSGSSGAAGSVNHWGVWANEEQTISEHVEPALDDLVSVLTTGFLRPAVEGTTKVVGYDTATLRLRQDRSKEAMELYDRGLLKGEIALRENGFDPSLDMMEKAEEKIFLLKKVLGGTFSPEQMEKAFEMLTGVDLPAPDAGSVGGQGAAPQLPGRSNDPNLDGHPVEGPPQVDHNHNDAVYSVRMASCEALVLRAMEKAGNRLLNDGKRGRDKNRETPPHRAHLTASIARGTFRAVDFDFSTAAVLLPDLDPRRLGLIIREMGVYCAEAYNSGLAYDRDALFETLRGL